MAVKTGARCLHNQDCYAVVRKAGSARAAEDQRPEGRLLRSTRKPYPQFRLLTILSGDLQDQLQCSLAHFELDNESTPEYETTSYCWGDAARCHPIKLNGKETLITESSAGALRRMRHVDRQRVVWIDALCINRADLSERANQVRLMDRIYRGGKNNMIYLGEDISETLSELDAIWKEAESKPELLGPVMADRDVRYTKLDTNHVTVQYDVQRMSDLFSNSWFHRVWTLQEAIRSPHSICLSGSSIFPLRTITDTACWLYANRRFHDVDLFDLVDEIETLAFLMDPATDLRRLACIILSVSQKRVCTLTVDHVYGMYALIGPLGHAMDERIMPDYNKSPARVYTETARSLVESMGTLSILAMKHNASIVAGDLPSWVPCFDKPWVRSEDPTGLRCRTTKADQNRDVMLRPSLPRASETPPADDDSPLYLLDVCGVHVSGISTTSDRYKDNDSDNGGDNTHWHWFQHVDEVAQKVLPEGRTWNKSEELDLATTLVGGVEASRQPISSDKLERLLEAYKAGLQPGVFWDNVTLVMNPDLRTAFEFSHTMSEVCVHRRMFVTTDGRYGLGPHLMTIDDIVAVLYGYFNPVILRLKGDHFQFIGEAYVHGIMEGQALDAPELYKERFFSLC